MNTVTRILTAATVLLVISSQSFGEEPPAKQWVWLESQGVYGYGYQLQEGPHRGLWRVDPNSKRAPEDTVPTTDAYGFAAVLNQYRAEAGLPPLAYDHELSAWAAANNAAQASQGIGHHVTANCYQNCAWNSPDAGSVGQAWMESRGHRQNMLSSSVTRFGIAYGPGPYWTMNAK
jgi:uncharacterized protein YkwD